VIGEGERGFCGLRTVRGGKLVHLAGTPSRGLLHWYRDPLPTNCVAEWVCEGRKHYGYHNLAVFYQSCTANCLFCQNWHFKHHSLKGPRASAAELADAAGPHTRTRCICFFGGDPVCQLEHALAPGRLARQQDRDRILRICWETNGSMNPGLLDEMIDLALGSGGCIKFDLKAWDENLHQALTGVPNRRTLENFRRAGEKAGTRPDPPLVIASTLLVPGYVEEEEVRSLAHFIASVNPEIPYSLLAFYPHFYMSDLPLVPRYTAEKCLQAAREGGVRNLRLGNVHLLR